MTKTAKILIIDDDIDFVAATKMILESGNYEVVTAHQGDEGLTRAGEEKPNLIILDVIMPAKDGFTVAEQLKGNPELTKIPVIMLTAFGQRERKTTIPVSRGLSLEVEDYIEKPVDPEELLARVRKQLMRAGR